MIVVPQGLVPLDFAKKMRDPVSGNRTQWFTYELLDNGEAPKGRLSNVTGGRLEWHANAAIKGGGKITIASRGRDETNWLKRRVKIVMHIDGLGEYPLGVYIPSAPVEKWDDMNLTLDIELLDKCSILADDYVLDTYSLASGTVVTTAVKNLITGTGEKAGSITDGTETLSKGMTWEAGTSKLEIINDLLEAANYFSLQVDGNGKFRVEKYRLPKNRTTVHKFVDDENCTFSPVFTYEKDIYSIPNKVVLISQGDGTAAGMTATATNENANSPYSYQSRGRWIVDVTRGVEATDQTALNERAAKRLAQLSSPTGMLSIDHAPLPWMGVNDVVQFRRNEAEINVRAVVSSTQIDLDPTALQRTALQEVAEL